MHKIPQLIRWLNIVNILKPNDNAQPHDANESQILIMDNLVIFIPKVREGIETGKEREN